MNAWRSRESAIARRNSGLSNGGAVRLISRSRLLLSITTSQTACGTWLLMSFNSGIVAKMKSSLPATKARCHVAGLAMIVYSMPSRYGRSCLPVIRVAGHRDVLVGLVFDEFERAGADRVLPHLRSRNVAGIDRRLARGEQRDQVGLRPLQMEGDLVIAVGRDVLDVAVPGLARVDAELVGVDAAQPIPGAFDVGRGERLAVVPFDAVA